MALAKGRPSKQLRILVWMTYQGMLDRKIESVDIDVWAIVKER